MQSIFEQLPIEITKSSEFVRIFLSLFIPYRTLNVNYLEELKLDKIIYSRIKTSKFSSTGISNGETKIRAIKHSYLKTRNITCRGCPKIAKSHKYGENCQTSIQEQASMLEWAGVNFGENRKKMGGWRIFGVKILPTCSKNL